VWTVALLAIYRVCDLALSIVLKRRRQRLIDREIAAERERQRLIALAGLSPGSRRVRVHVPVETTKQFKRQA